MQNRVSRLLLILFLSGALPTLAFAQTSTPLQGPPLTEILELRGVAKINGMFEFSIYNKERQRSEWLRPKERLEGYEILEYNFDELFVVVRFNDRIGRIPLHHAQVAAYQGDNARPTPTPPIPTQLPPTPPPGVSESGAPAFANARQRAATASRDGQTEPRATATRGQNPSGGFLPARPGEANTPPPTGQNPGVPGPTPRPQIPGNPGPGQPPQGGNTPPSTPGDPLADIGPPPPMPSVPMPSYTPTQ
jgi:hypothetical protein